MKTKFRQLSLVRRYFWGSLIIAIVPVLLLAAVYDRYTSGLNERLVLEKLDGEIQVTSVRIDSFIAGQKKRLDDLVDLPGMAIAFSQSSPVSLPASVLDFLFLEVGDPDIYRIVFYDARGAILHAFPALPAEHQRLPAIAVNQGTEAIVSEPELPANGRPGWFLVHKAVVRDGEAIGTLALQMRLASLTEQAASLYRVGVHEPIFLTPQSKALTVVGQLSADASLLSASKLSLHGWRIGLQRRGEVVSDPGFRIWLLLAAALSTIAVVVLFMNMSGRLARMIKPIQAGAQAIAQGDLNTRVPETAPGELGVLAKAFNEMSRQLSTMIRTRVDAERRANLGNLAAGIAHEIRNPLATMQATVHGLTTSEADAGRREMLEEVTNEIARTDTIVEEFLHYARPSTTQREPIYLDDLTHSVVVLTSSTALEAGIKISQTGEKKLLVNVDAGQLRQVLMNVVLNAIEAMPDGGFLYIRANRRGKYAELTVIDTGIGIAQDVLLNIQQPFFTTKRNGTGLGLAICSQLVQANHGEIHFESQQGQGTTVRITVELAINHPTAGGVRGKRGA